MKDYYLTPNGNFFAALSWEEQFNFDEMIMSALPWTNTLSYVFIVVTL